MDIDAIALGKIMQLLLEKCMLPQFGDDVASYNRSYGVRQRHAAPANRARSPRQKLHELGENQLPTSQGSDRTANCHRGRFAANCRGFSPVTPRCTCALRNSARRRP